MIMEVIHEEFKAGMPGYKGFPNVPQGCCAPNKPAQWHTLAKEKNLHTKLWDKLYDDTDAGGFTNPGVVNGVLVDSGANPYMPSAAGTASKEPYPNLPKKLGWKKSLQNLSTDEWLGYQ